MSEYGTGATERPWWDRYFPLLMLPMLVGNFAILWTAAGGTWVHRVGLALTVIAVFYLLYVQVDAVRDRPEEYPEVTRS